MSRSVSIGLLLVAAACAAGDRPQSREWLCSLDRPSSEAPIDHATWLTLLLRGWDPGTRRATSPAVDCTGAQVRWEAPAHQCADGSTVRAILPDKPLAADDVVVAPVGDAFRIVWVVTNRFASGDGLGPAAVVEVKGSRLVVRAVGHLRANVVRPRLRLERIGPAEVLVAEGEICASADPASCARSARVMPLAGDRYVPASVVDVGGTCVAPALFHLGREEVEALSSGRRRRYRLDATLTFRETGAVVHEQMVVNDFDPRHPNAPARLFRRAESETELRFDGANFASGGPSLWTRVLEAK